MATDPLAEALEQFREREQKAAPGPWAVVRDRYEDEPGEEFPAALRLPEPQRWQLPDGTMSKVTECSYEYSDFGELTPETVEWIAAARTSEPRLTAALEAVRRITDGWASDAPAAPSLDRGTAARVIREAITRELLGEEAHHG